MGLEPQEGIQEEQDNTDSGENEFLHYVQTAGGHDTMIYKIKRQMGEVYYKDADGAVLLHLHRYFST